MTGLHPMNHKSSALIEFKVNQAIGSFAIEGISTSKEDKLLMLSIANGTANPAQVRASLLEKYQSKQTHS